MAEAASPPWQSSPARADGWELLRYCGYSASSAQTTWRSLGQQRYVGWPEALEALRRLATRKSRNGSIEGGRARVLAELQTYLARSLSEASASAEPVIIPPPASDQRVDLPQELAELLGHAELPRVRKTPDDMYALMDVGMAITGKDARHAAEDLRIVLERYPEFSNSEMDGKLVHVEFAQRGPRTSTKVGDLAKVVEYIMLLPGAMAARVRVKAAKILVRYLGGDLRLIDEVRTMHQVQEHLAEVDPADWRRAFGEAVEADAPQPDGEETRKRRRLEEQLQLEILEANHQEAKAKADEAKAKADEAAAVALARKQSLYTETQIQTVARVEAAGSALERLRNILPPGTIESAAGRMADTLVTIATSHPKTDEDYGAPLRLVQFLVDELKCDEEWAFKKVPFFGRCAKEEVDKAFPGVVFPRTTVRYNGQDYMAHQYYERQRDALRKALPRFLAKHPRPAPVGRDIGSFLLRRPTTLASSSTGPVDL